MTSVEVRTPMMKPLCWLRGLSPIKYPVFRSCDVAPALAAATQTIAPTHSATAWYTSPVRPSATNTTHVAMIVAIVMPEIGFDDVPMIPTMREDTVTKKNPNTTTRSPMTSEPGKGPCGKPGRTVMRRARTMEPMTTTPMPRSLSVRLTLLPSAPAPNYLTDSRNADTIVGSVLTRVMTPAQATAPAPMYRT